VRKLVVVVVVDPCAPAGGNVHRVSRPVMPMMVVSTRNAAPMMRA